MPAPKRIPDSKVKEALSVWRGNLSAAADELGMQTKNLRKRLPSLAVDEASIQSGERGHGPIPIKASTSRAIIRVTPAHRDRLREARFDLSAKYRAELSESAILEAFIEEAFSGWLASKLEPRS